MNIPRKTKQKMNYEIVDIYLKYINSDTYQSAIIPGRTKNNRSKIPLAILQQQQQVGALQKKN